MKCRDDGDEQRGAGVGLQAGADERDSESGAGVGDEIDDLGRHLVLAHAERMLERPEREPGGTGVTSFFSGVRARSSGFDEFP